MTKLSQPPDLKLQLKLATLVAELIEEIGYARTLDILERECKLVSVGKRAEELSKKLN
jgi:hypothetical protein